MRILIVRLSAIGDTALTLPLAAELRERLPGAFIGWAVGETAAPLVEDAAESIGIDRVHVWRRSERNFTGLRRLAREVRRERYDVSLDAQSLTQSAAIPFLARVPRRVGFARYHKGGRELAPFFNNELNRPPESARHVGSQTLHRGTALGLAMPERTDFRLSVNERAAVRIREWWGANGLTDRTLVIGLGAGWPTKVLPARTVARRARAANERGRRCVLLWGPAERDELDSWREAFGESAIPAPRTDLREMVALASLAGRYAGPDSAALHVAALLGKPTFGWFGASDPEITAPRGPGHVHVAKDIPCRPCWKRRCPSPRCVLEFPAEDILPAFTAWLAGEA